MKKGFTAILAAAIITLTAAAPMSVTASASVSSSSSTSTVESEHPPLSEATKKAIAAYKKDPTEANKKAVEDALNAAYDAVIEKKKQNYAEDLANRDKSISKWFKTVISGGTPAFLDNGIGDAKGNERQAVSDSIAAYRKKKSATNKAAVKTALTAYYDAFLTEQAYHIEETIALQSERVAAQLEYFTSDRFPVGKGAAQEEKATESEVLAEMICTYISAGAQIVPVNHEARVRERTYNASIKAAQSAYLADPTAANKQALYDAVYDAYKAAYDARVEMAALANTRGQSAADTLFTKMLDSSFVSEQYKELTVLLNLCGQIDRTVTYGSNTYSGWTPRLKGQSIELAELIAKYRTSATSANKKAVREKFNELYSAVLEMQNKHLDEVGTALDTYVTATVNGLI